MPNKSMLDLIDDIDLFYFSFAKFGYRFYIYEVYAEIEVDINRIDNRSSNPY